MLDTVTTALHISHLLVFIITLQKGCDRLILQMRKLRLSDFKSLVRVHALTYLARVNSSHWLVSEALRDLQLFLISPDLPCPAVL